MADSVTVDEAIAALKRLGFEPSMERGDLIGLDTFDTHEYPVVLDRSLGVIPVEDLLDHVRGAGITMAQLSAALAVPPERRLPRPDEGGQGGHGVSEPSPVRPRPPQAG